MNLQENIDRIKDIMGIEDIQYVPVYRGEKEEHIGNSIWVSEDEEFASEYGEVTKYLMPSNLNILDVEYNYSEWEELIDEFDPEAGDYDEYAYEPTPEFIDYLMSNGYDGFQNDLNILIFDKSKLVKPE